MDHTISASLVALSLFAGMLLLFEAGRRLGARKLVTDPRTETELGTVEGAVFALFGLLVAFTFSGAMQRFDAHRSLIAEETNAIGTAYLRLDLLPKDAQPALRELFRNYVDSRLGFYRKLSDREAAGAEQARWKDLQSRIWSQAVAATRSPDAHPDAAKLLFPALNEMFDITTTRQMASRLHPPRLIFILLYVLALGCSLLTGYGTAGSRRIWVHVLGFTVVTVVTIYVILDIEYPRHGLIRADTYDQVLIDLRSDMK